VREVIGVTSDLSSTHPVVVTPCCMWRKELTAVLAECRSQGRRCAAFEVEWVTGQHFAIVWAGVVLLFCGSTGIVMLGLCVVTNLWSAMCMSGRMSRLLSSYRAASVGITVYQP
jgi:hypothetical protein